jgi:hypothetical protein
MKHKHIILWVGLAVLLTACAGEPQDVDYPIPGINSRPTATLAMRGTLTVTVNVTDDLDSQGDWSGWTISEEIAPDFLEPNCSLYRIPGTAPQQWIGMCRMTIREVFALPWYDSDIFAVVEDQDGNLAMYQSLEVVRE